MAKKPSRVNTHRSFKRSFREDYQRGLEVPGIMYHVIETFKILFKNFKLFLPFLAIMACSMIAFVGMAEETNYVNLQKTFDEVSLEASGRELGQTAKAGLLLISMVATSGAANGSSESNLMFGGLIFLTIWLVTVFLLRHILAKREIKLRDALYNAMTPLISTFVVLLIILIQCIPIFLLIIAYAAAVRTDFLAVPFYALLFFVFAVLMVILSGYLLSSSLMALIAVSVPGMYPIKAMRVAADLMMGRRLRFVIRLIALFITLAIVWVIVMLPLILFDLRMKTFTWTSGVPFIPICLVVMTCFTGIYATAYLYLYYRWMVGYDEK